MWVNPEQFKPKDQTLPYKVYSALTLARMVKNITERIDMTKIVITGSQGTGKTNLAVSVSLYLSDMLAREGRYCAIIYARGENILFILNSPTVLLQELEKKEQNLGKRFDYLIFIFDDFSYVLNHQEVKALGLNKYLLLQTFVKLRHIFQKRRIVIFATIHYRTAVLPVLRDSQIFLYTAINTEQLAGFKNHAIERYAKAYIRYFNAYYVMNNAFRLPAKLDNTLSVDDGRLVMKEEAKSIDEHEHEHDYVHITISDKSERLALADFGTTHAFIYYNIILRNGLFDVSTYPSFYVLSMHKDNEGFIISDDNIIKISLTFERQGQEAEGSESSEHKLANNILYILSKHEKIDEYRLYDMLVKNGLYITLDEAVSALETLENRGMVYHIMQNYKRIWCLLR